MNSKLTVSRMVDVISTLLGDASRIRRYTTRGGVTPPACTAGCPRGWRVSEGKRT